MQRLLLGLVALYQRTVSPLLSLTRHPQDIPHCCKFYPSCSEYARQCLQRYPWYSAVGRSIWRVVRCHPWSKGGVDLP
ncbi:membrane protein insertion efficiency factor YidD [Candidatus Peribacteria bacterium]|nr:membrane protein insertion efficiency factor YidD [Candidatus Peribacteria bacterium]